MYVSKIKKHQIRGRCVMIMIRPKIIFKRPVETGREKFSVFYQSTVLNRLPVLALAKPDIRTKTLGCRYIRRKYMRSHGHKGTET